MTPTYPVPRRSRNSPVEPVLPRARRGHTLTEMLVVMTILALITGVAIPRFISALSRSHLDAAYDATRGALLFARARAVASGVRHQFTLDTSTGELVVEAYRPEESLMPPAPGVQPPEPPLRDRLPEDVRIVDWSVAPLGYVQPGTAGAGMAPGPTGQAANAALVFYPEGQGDGATLVLEDADGRRRGLELDPLSGEVREMDAERLRESTPR